MPAFIMGNSKTITVKTEGGDVIVRKLALEDYAALLRALKKLPVEVGKFVEGNSTDQLKDTNFLLTQLPSIIADAIPEFAEVLAVASDKSKEFHLKELDLADNLEVFAAALELNDYRRIVDTVKKLTARGPAVTAAPAEAASTTGSTEQ